MADERKGAWLSPESYERLRSELEEMTTTGRAEIARKIEAARSEGDQAAREEQAKMEGRIAELTHLLENATVSEPPTAAEVAAGTVVTALISGEEERFLLGSREAADLVGIEVYPENAPLGKAILGLKKGDTTSFATRTGRKISVEILDIEPFQG